MHYREFAEVRGVVQWLKRQPNLNCPFQPPPKTDKTGQVDFFSTFLEKFQTVEKSKARF
jgi:hypothetical protein